MKFSNKYEYMQSSIIIEPREFEYDLLDGAVKFYNYNDEEEKNTVVDIIFSVFNCYDPAEFWEMADSISADFLFVATAYSGFCEEAYNGGSIAIIDEFIFNDEVHSYKEKKYIIKLCLEEINKFFNVLGINRIVFMTKALILDLDIKNRLDLVNEVFKIGYLPIYQGENDVVVARNLDYR